MSVLSIPRIFFRGQSAWNPATMNNNARFPTYDYRTADLNWDYLGTQKVDGQAITRKNFRELFPKWAHTFQKPGRPEWEEEPPAEWGFYGASDWWLHTPPRYTLDGKGVYTQITGGQTEYGGDPNGVNGDPLVGAVINLAGDPFPVASRSTEEAMGADCEFPRSAYHTNCTMVDTNPYGTWSTSFFARRLQIGSRTSPEEFFFGDIDEGTCLSSRWINFGRNLNIDPLNGILLDGVGGAVFQIGIRKEKLTFADDGSPLLLRLRDEMERTGAQGIMMRFCAYLTTYFPGPDFADLPDVKERYKKLLRLWEEDRKAGSPPRRNPCVSKVVGSIGLWHAKELATVPGGRFLAPRQSLRVEVPEDRTKPYRDAWFGPAAAEVHKADGDLHVSLDMGMTVPERGATGEKEDAFGALELVLSPAGPEGDAAPRVLAEIKPQEYARPAYERTAGILDIPVGDLATEEELASGLLSLRCRPDGEQLTMLAETELTAQTDDRGVFVEEDETVTVPVEVRLKGEVPGPDAAILVRAQEYLQVPRPPAACAMDWSLPESDDERTLDILEETVPVVDGRAEIRFRPVTGEGKLPGIPTVVFFPYREVEQPPEPPREIRYAPGPVSHTTAFYCAVRVMPFDNGLPGEFSDHCEQHGNDPVKAWEFVYDRILYAYDMVFPVMKHYAALDLGNREVVDRNIELILELSSPQMRHSSLFMPINRDLSKGRRQVLAMYRDLIRAGRT